MSNGQMRNVLAENAIKNKSQSALNEAFKNENETVKAIKKFPLKNPTKNNHSK